MPLTPRTRFEWQLRTRAIALGVETKIMGILNVTPDSFSDGGRFVVVEAAMERALGMLDEGAHILDVGGESTRPNAVPISADEEQARVLPVIEAILMERPDALISIDTFHAATARAAVGMGAEIVNDVSGFSWDSAMAQICGETGCGVVLMHTRGRPQQWTSLPAIDEDDVVSMVLAGLRGSVSAASDWGVARERIVVDPGFGFGKKGDENYSLLAGLEELRQLGLPVLSGTSRKGFLGASLKHLYDGEPAPLSERVNATTAANVASVLAGAHILRVHDVRAAVESAAVSDSILRAATGVPA
jgi:dihydropteroate synthase